MRDNQLDNVLDRLRELFQREYDRGSQEGLKRIVDTIKGGPNCALGSASKCGKKQRAARGSARAFIERVLKEKKTASVDISSKAADSSAVGDDAS